MVETQVGSDGGDRDAGLTCMRDAGLSVVYARVICEHGLRGPSCTAILVKKDLRTYQLSANLRC